MTLALAVTYWALIFVFVGISLTLAMMAWSTHSPVAIIASGASLTAALTVASLPGPEASPLLATFLGLSAITLGVAGGGPAATITLSLATRGTVSDGTHGGILTVKDPQREVLRGGLTIGLLERLAVTSTIVAGMPAALALIVAIKSVGRFSELDVAEARERFIIGTLISLIWAGACGALVVLALDQN